MNQHIRDLVGKMLIILLCVLALWVFNSVILRIFWFHSSRVGLWNPHFNKNTRGFCCKRSANHILRNTEVYECVRMCLWVLLVYEWNALVVWVIGVQAFLVMASTFSLTCQHQYFHGAVQRAVLSRSLRPHLDRTGKKSCDWWMMSAIGPRRERGSLQARCLPSLPAPTSGDTEQGLGDGDQRITWVFIHPATRTDVTRWLPQVTLWQKKIKSRCLVKGITKQEMKSCPRELLFASILSLVPWFPFLDVPSSVPF